MPVLVIAQHNNSDLNPATLNTVSAAAQIDSDVHVLVAGSGNQVAAEAAAKISGVSKVIKVDAPELEKRLAENHAPVIVANAQGYSHILAPATTFGKNVMPRAAALLDTQQISDIIGVIDGDTFKRPIYGGQAIAEIKSSDPQKAITVRPTAFDAAAAEGGSAEITDGSASGDAGLSSFAGLEASESDRPDLSSAKIVVSGGRGFGSKENFEMIEKLADKLGAAIGASRAAVDSGYVPNDYQVGQTGKVVAPELYIAIGISGAIQHLAGMKDSKIIVAINKDEEAPIFNIADYGLVADLFEAVPELTDKL